eukprot:3971214-Amphidinium_carterae.4
MPEDIPSTVPQRVLGYAGCVVLVESDSSLFGTRCLDLDPTIACCVHDMEGQPWSVCGCKAATHVPHTGADLQ